MFFVTSPTPLESDSKLITLDKQPRPDAKGEVEVKARAVRWQMDFADQAMDIRAAISFIAGEPNDEARSRLEKNIGIATSANNAEVAERADILFIGVKPAIVLPALRDLAALANGKLIISLAAGVRLKAMEAVTAGRVMRAMTNTPSAICRAATALARGSRDREVNSAAISTRRRRHLV